jgi:hypothetical protein
VTPMWGMPPFFQPSFPSFPASSGMFWEFFIGRDKGLIPRSGRRYRS